MTEPVTVKPSTSDGKLEILISSTALGSSACILKFYRTVIQGYKTIPSAKIVYGIAVHKFIDTMYQSGGNIKLARDAMQKAFNIPKEEEFKSKHMMDEKHCMTTCLNLWTTYIEQDATFDVLMLGGKPATEITFKILYHETDTIRVFLCGTLDTLGQVKGGCFAIRDWKTTSSPSDKPWDFTNYFRTYERSRQLRFYTLACKLMAEREPDSTLGKMGATRMGAFIDAIFIRSNPNDNVVKRSEVFQYKDEEISAFRSLLNAFIAKLVSAVKANSFPQEGLINGSCGYGNMTCGFWAPCNVAPHIAEILLKRDFKQVPYNPANYNDL